MERYEIQRFFPDQYEWATVQVLEGYSREQANDRYKVVIANSYHAKYGPRFRLIQVLEVET